MQLNKLFAGAALATIALLPGANAFATCTNALASGAKWHMHAIEVDPTGASAIQCLLTFGASGRFTNAPCEVFQVGSSTPQTATVSGRIVLNATSCNFTGTVAIPGDPTVIIKTGHINTNVGAGTAIQDTGANTEVLHLTLVKQ